MPLDPVLAHIPGLAGYLAQDEQSRAAETGQLQRAAAGAGLMQHFQTLRDTQAARAALQGLGPDSTAEDQIRAVAPFASPKEIMDYGGRHLDRQAQIKATQEMGLARLQQAANQFEQTYQLKRSQVTNKQEQDAIDNIFKQRKLMLDAEAQRISGRKLYWETGEGGFGNVNVGAVPQVPASAAPGSQQWGPVAAGTPAPVADAAAQIRQNLAQGGPGGNIDLGVLPPSGAPQAGPSPSPAPQQEDLSRFLDPRMPPEIQDSIRNAVPKDRGPLAQKWREANYGPKAQQTFATDTAIYRDVMASYDKLKKQAGLVKDSKLGRVTGIPGMVPNVPGQAGSVAISRLEGLKSMIVADTLKAIKALSQNGASGFGNLSDKEGAILSQQLGNLHNATSEAELRRVVGDIESFVDDAKARLTTAYKEKHAAQIGTPGVRRNALFNAADKIVGGSP